jgi:phosphate transport system protein
MDHQYSLYDKELSELKAQVLKMGSMVEALIADSIDSLKRLDIDLAEKVIKQDALVDRKELEIDEQCINLIALRQPKANDLRFITTGMRIATDLERIGDLAESIAQRTIELSGLGLLKPLIDIPKLAVLVQEILRTTLEAYINGNSAKAISVWDKEREIDELRNLIHDELMDLIKKDPGVVAKAIPLLLVSRHLERIADHATNIAEDVVYMVEAKVIKHSGIKK